MIIRMKITVLGSGTSMGVPVIGCSCKVCRSQDPKDKRMRASLYVEGEAGEAAVIDTGPEFRLQALRAGISRLDAVFLTHAHADHLHGLDDIRPLNRGQPIPVYGSGGTIAEMRERFSYVFRESAQRGGGKPQILPVETSEPVRLGGLVFTPLPVKHGILDIFGWKIEEDRGRTAVYLTDCSFIPPETRGLIHKPDLLIIGALRKRPHETHFSFRQALEESAALGAGKTFFTHICHAHTHDEIAGLCKRYAKEDGLPLGAPAWDGLSKTLV
jgi:phosphoribosyl 1,2-cyclic phosphate phosphodiesterase